MVVYHSKMQSPSCHFRPRVAAMVHVFSTALKHPACHKNLCSHTGDWGQSTRSATSRVGGSSHFGDRPRFTVVQLITVSDCFNSMRFYVTSYFKILADESHGAPDVMGLLLPFRWCYCLVTSGFDSVENRSGSH